VRRKFFPRDKNYILEGAQLSLEHNLLHYLVDFVKVEYLLRNNPLGIADNTTQQIQAHQGDSYEMLHEFYLNLAGVFRFTYYGDNQLEFIFDGQDDSEKYQLEWTLRFKSWTKAFCQYDNFVHAVLELTVFYPEDYTPQMAGLRLSAFISRQFEVKIDANKGISKKNVA
jgi:hypothetical protein